MIELIAIAFNMLIDFVVIILGNEKINQKTVWDLILPKEILDRNIPKDAIQKKKFKNSDVYSSLIKRTQTSLTPYESVGK